MLRPDPFHGRIEIVEQVSADPSGDLGAEPTMYVRFVDHDARWVFRTDVLTVSQSIASARWP